MWIGREIALPWELVLGRWVWGVGETSILCFLLSEVEMIIQTFQGCHGQHMGQCGRACSPEASAQLVMVALVMVVETVRNVNGDS